MKSHKATAKKRISKRTRGIEEDQCYACEVVLTKGNREWHHFPVPARSGGEHTVPLCKGCHDMVDRLPLGEWPVDWAFKAVSELNREGKLFLMKAMSKLWTEKQTQEVTVNTTSDTASPE